MLIAGIKGSWSLTGTRFLGKVWLLAWVMVKAMAMTNVQILRVRRHHRLIPKIGCRWLGMHYIQRTLGRIAPCRSCGDRHSALSRVPLIVGRITPDRHSGRGNGSLPRIPRPWCGRSSWVCPLCRNNTLHRNRLSKIGISPNRESKWWKGFVTKLTEQRKWCWTYQHIMRRWSLTPYFN